MAREPRLSVVLPAYHQGDVITDSVRRVREALVAELAPEDVEIIVVDDGSGDDTATRAEAAGADRVIVHPANRGKGAAVRSGTAVARGRTVAFTDADLAYAPAELLRLLREVEAGADVVVGSRRHDDAVVVVPTSRLRSAGGWLVSRLSRTVLRGRYRDTQCGLKAFRAEAVPVVLGQGLIDGFAFDIEVLHLAEASALRVVEVPVQVTNSPESTVRAGRDGLRLVRDLLRIRGFAKRGRYRARSVG